MELLCAAATFSGTPRRDRARATDAAIIGGTKRRGMFFRWRGGARNIPSGSRSNQGDGNVVKGMTSRNVRALRRRPMRRSIPFTNPYQILLATALLVVASTTLHAQRTRARDRDSRSTRESSAD